MASRVFEEEEEDTILPKPECHSRLDVEILIPLLSHIRASRSCLSFNAYNFGDDDSTSTLSSASSSSSSLILRGLSEHLEISNSAKDDLELIYLAVCANRDANSSTTLNGLDAASTTTSSQAVRIEVLKSSHNSQLLTDVTIVHGSSMSDVRQLADLLRKYTTPEKSFSGLPLAYGTRARLWRIMNHGAELLGRAISNDTTLHALDLCSCCLGTKDGLEILLQPFMIDEAGQQPNDSSISNPFVSWNSSDASCCVPATKRFSQHTNSIASLYQMLEGTLSSPELSGSAGLLSASIISFLISLRETHALQSLDVRCCPGMKGNEVLGTIFDLLQVNISMEKISFNGVSLEQDGSEKHLIQSLLDQIAEKRPDLDEGEEDGNIGPMSQRESLSIPPLKAGCSLSCSGIGAYIDKGKSVSCGNGHQREWTNTKVKDMGVGKRQRLRKEINRKQDDVDCDVEALSITAANVEPMTLVASLPAKVHPVKPGSIEECMLCRNSKTKDKLFLTRCRHQFCFNCIKEHVCIIVQAQMATRNPNFATLVGCPRCLITSCQEELSRSELVKLLGHNIVQAYERWLLSAYEGLFGSFIRQGSEKPALLKLCSSTVCDPRNPTTGLSTNFQDLFPLKEKNEGSKVFLCTSCDGGWCASGVHLPVIQQHHTGSGDNCNNTNNNSSNRVHSDCSGQEKFLLFKSMVELKDAFEIYTQGSCQKGMNPEQKTSQKRNRTSIWADGTGYGGDYNENKIQTEFTQAEAKRKEAEVDSKVAHAFQFLTCILNNSHHHRRGGQKAGEEEEEETPSFSPITTTIYALLFGWGNALQQLLLLLTANDSMLDISERSKLYLQMVELLKAVTSHKEIFLVFTAGYTTTTTSQKTVVEEASQHDRFLLQRSTSSISSNKLPNTDDDAFVLVNKDSTLIKKMENIYLQAKVMLQQFQSNGMSVGEAAADVDITLAKQLCVCYELMQEKEMKDGGGVTELAPDMTIGLPLKEVTESNAQRELLEAAAAHKESIQIIKKEPTNYKEKLRPLQFRQMSMVDESGTYTHHFKDHIVGKVSASSCIDRRGVHNHKRMLHLSKEIALLATTLPLEWESSIHICVDDQRLDVLRALIIGPHATPYQNGIFLFDIFLPPDYPQVPPSVHFMTTGGGGVRFNPNLYNIGKICLSLLGTWNGPGWIPGRSTLLQVLVSIQSLIFVQNPYYNEPGYEQSMHGSEAEHENMCHREHTLSLAVLAPLRKPDAMFADVINEYFQHKQEEVEQQCQQWCAYASDINTKNRMANLTKDIKAQLQILCCLA